MGVAGEAEIRGERLAAEVVEILLGEASLQERARVDSGRRVTLEEDLVPGRLVRAAEEVIEADLVEAGGAGIGGEVAADALETGVRAQHHCQRVPADHPPDAVLHRLVTGEVGLLLGADRVDVARLRQGRKADVQLAGALQEPEQDEAGTLRPGSLDEGIERVEPLRGLDRVDVRELLLELVEDLVDGLLHRYVWYRPMPASGERAIIRDACARSTDPSRPGRTGS